MAREHIIRQWCDRHLTEKDERVPADQVIVGFDRAGWVRLDLCEECTDAYVTKLRVLARDVGTPINAAGDEMAPRVRRPRAARPAPDMDAPGVKLHPCLLCDATFTKTASLSYHAQTAHGLAGPLGEAMFGTRCPLCGKAYDKYMGLSLHVRSGHAEARTAARAFQLAIMEGDPHEVVAERRAELGVI